jgi:hypothetical protein
MTAEEYLETRRCNSAISNKFDMCYMDAAYKAIEMAREEEREKADKAFSKVIKALDVSNSKWYEELEKDFLELINQ